MKQGMLYSAYLHIQIGEDHGDPDYIYNSGENKQFLQNMMNVVHITPFFNNM